MLRWSKRMGAGTMLWTAHEVESHGYSWEVAREGQYVADVKARGDGEYGRAEVLALASVDPDATVTFHTFAEWLKTPASEGGGMEPFCNHDPVAVDANGVCECGARMVVTDEGPAWKDADGTVRV